MLHFSSSIIYFNLVFTNIYIYIYTVYFQDLHSFQWSNQWPINYLNWDLSEPILDNDIRIVSMDVNTGRWSVKMGALFVCLDTITLAAPPPPSMPPSTGGTCTESFWMPFGRYCYLFGGGFSLFSQAFGECQRYRSTLVTFGSSIENEVVHRRALGIYLITNPRPPIDPIRWIWIG